jgi:hypothetical protein
MIPMTYTEAVALFRANGGYSFSFVVAPYGVLKTVVKQNGYSVAVPPTAYGREEAWPF